MLSTRLPESVVSEALGAARRLRAHGEWQYFRDNGQKCADKKVLFGLLEHYSPFLRGLCDGVVEPGATTMCRGSAAEANSIQIAWRQRKKPTGVRIHIDNPNSLHYDGAPQRNATLNLGVVLQGATGERNDAANILVVPKSHLALADAYKRHHPCARCAQAESDFRSTSRRCSLTSWRDSEVVSYHSQPESMSAHYLGSEKPELVALNAAPGFAYLLHHQTLHGTAPNNSDDDRVVVYFRIRAAGANLCLSIYPLHLSISRPARRPQEPFFSSDARSDARNVSPLAFASY